MLCTAALMEEKADTRIRPPTSTAFSFIRGIALFSMGFKRFSVILTLFSYVFGRVSALFAWL